MQKGDTVIFNNDHIEELTRHRDKWLQVAQIEKLPQYQENANQQLAYYEKQLDWALQFQQAVTAIKYEDVPQITTILTESGMEIPANRLQTI